MKSQLHLALLASALAAAVAAQSPYAMDAPLHPRGRLDERLFARLHELGIAPAQPCSDAVFLRRLFLAALGTLPTADEARRFLLDPAPEKRDTWIDLALARPEFATDQAMRWGDVLRVKAEFPVNLWPNAAQAYHRWLTTAMVENRPYDRFLRQLLLATGSNFRSPEANFWRSAAERTPAGLGRAVALSTLGARSERWPAAHQQGFAALFARVAWKPTQEWKEEIVFVDHDRAAPTTAMLPDGTAIVLAAGSDPRTVFADWALDGNAPPAAPAVVNRIWSWLWGRGLVHETDDFRPDNPPTHPDVLSHLAAELVGAHWDLKHVYRLILRSAAWQLSPLPASDDALAESHFAHYPLRKLDAEVLIDALCQLTGTHEEYQSSIPEPFSIVPAGTRAIALGDGSISSAVLELFGKPARDTGLAAERPEPVGPAQRLHLLNSSHVQQKLANGRLLRGLAPGADTDADHHNIDELYLRILSRFPTRTERDAAAKQLGEVRKPREAAEDLAWALINSAEFLFRH